MHKIHTDEAPKAIGPYSQGVLVDGFFFSSGQIALHPETGEVVGENIVEQTTQVMKNLQAVLEKAGAGFDSVIKTTCFLTNINDFAEFNEVYGAFFQNKPARSCVEVSKLPRNVLVEVEVIAKQIVK